MNRLEFCELLVSARKSSKTTTKDISLNLRMLISHVYKFESGKHSFKISSLMEYLNYIGYSLILKSSASELRTDNVMEIGPFLMDNRESKDLSYYKVGKDSGISGNSVRNAEKDSSKMSIDTLLKICDVLGIEVRLEVKNG